MLLFLICLHILVQTSRRRKEKERAKKIHVNKIKKTNPKLQMFLPFSNITYV